MTAERNDHAHRESPHDADDREPAGLRAEDAADRGADDRRADDRVAGVPDATDTDDARDHDDAPDRGDARDRNATEADTGEARDGDGPEETGDASDTGDADDPRESAYALLQRGHDLMRSRHHAQAATVLARAARIEPRKGSILEALGRAYYNSGQHDRAAETFEALLDVDPSAHYAHYALGQSLKQLGRPREARTHLRLAVALSPHSRLYQAALDRLGTAGTE